MVHHYALFQNVLSLISSSLLPRRAVPFSRVHNDLALPFLFKSSPTVIEFANTGEEHHYLPPTPASSLGDTCTRMQRDQLYLGGLVPTDMYHERCRNCRHEDTLLPDHVPPHAAFSEVVGASSLDDKGSACIAENPGIGWSSPMFSQ